MFSTLSRIKQAKSHLSSATIVPKSVYLLVLIIRPPAFTDTSADYMKNNNMQAYANSANNGIRSVQFGSLGVGQNVLWRILAYLRRMMFFFVSIRRDRV